MSTITEIQYALNILNNCEVSILHCHTQYPTLMKDANLLAIKTLKDTFDNVVGYSDHTLGIEASIGTVMLGAEIIEKHFTLSQNMTGPDHLASLEPIQLKNMIDCIRNLKRPLVNGVKDQLKTEKKKLHLLQEKSIIAKKYKER